MGINDEDYSNHWLYNNVENKALKRMKKQLDDIENYIYNNTDIIPSKVINDISNILWRRKWLDSNTIAITGNRPNRLYGYSGNFKG